MTRAILATAVTLFAVILVLVCYPTNEIDGSQSGALQKVERPTDGAVIAFADWFFEACANKNVVEIERGVVLPFTVFAPCKGGDFESVQDFRQSFLNPYGWPPVKELREKAEGLNWRIISLETFARALAATTSSKREDWIEPWSKRFGRDVRVVCLCINRDERPIGGLAIFVRADKGVLSAVAVCVGASIPLDP